MLSFSIIIPNYNKGPYIDDCVNSILNQTIDSSKIDSDDFLCSNNVLEKVDKHIKGEDIVFINFYKQGKNGITLVTHTPPDIYYKECIINRLKRERLADIIDILDTYFKTGENTFCERFQKSLY